MLTTNIESKLDDTGGSLKFLDFNYNLEQGQGAVNIPENEQYTQELVRSYWDKAYRNEMENNRLGNQR